MRWNRITTVPPSVRPSLEPGGLRGRRQRAARAGPAASGDADEAPQYNAAVGKVYNPSDKKGGTLRIGITEDWDSHGPR